MEKTMTPRKGRRLPNVPNLTDPLTMVQPHAAGIDAHSREHFVAVPPGSPPADFVNPDANLPAFVRIFGTNTADLEALALWLKQCAVTTVAVESTGVYHLPLVEVLEQHQIHIIIVDPRQTANAPGRPKTDVLDCQWIQRLHSYGLLRASFRPGPEIQKLRSYQRQRDMLINYAAAHIQHMQKALDLMNVKLTVVLSDITGATGMNIIKAILRGVRDPLRLAEYRDVRCQASAAEIAAALQGNWREEHLFSLRQAVKLYEEYQRQLRDCEDRIEACLRSFADRSGGKPVPPKLRRRGQAKNEVRFDAHELLFKMTGVDMTVIEGINESTALVLLSELGFDMSTFPHEDNFVSWLGLCPNHRGSGGKLKKRHVKPAASRANRAFRLAAMGCSLAKNAMGAFYRRIAGRSGGPKAIVATARKIAIRLYQLLKKGTEYVRQGMTAYEASYRVKVAHGLAKRAAELGYQLVPLTPTTA
jgi:transposase